MELLDLARKRAFFARYGPDVSRTVQQRGVDWRVVEKHARRIEHRLADYRRTARAIAQRIAADREMLEDSTWRDVTRRLWDSYWWRVRSLARVSHDNVATLMIATRIRLTMQRFVRRLRGLVVQARRRVRRRLA